MSKDLKIIILNGPAKSGKDTLCKGIGSYLNDQALHVDSEVVHMEYKELLFDIAIRASGLSPKLWFALYEREYKEKPCPYLLINGEQVSPRDWMIHCSETIMKPTFGDDIFGKAFVSKLEKYQAQIPKDKKMVVVVSDGGFIAEAIPAVNLVGPENYFLVRVHRRKPDGTEYDFTGDSRRYLYAEEFPEGLRPHEADIMNEEGDLDGTVKKICDFVWGFK